MKNFKQLLADDIETYCEKTFPLEKIKDFDKTMAMQVACEAGAKRYADMLEKALEALAHIDEYGKTKHECNTAEKTISEITLQLERKD